MELGEGLPKEDRIKKAHTNFLNSYVFICQNSIFIDHEGTTKDYVNLFINEEYASFPVCSHDDMFDCRARILDPNLYATFPKIEEPKPKQPYRYTGGAVGWMG